MMIKFILVGFALFAVLNSVRCDSSIDKVLQKVTSKPLRYYLSASGLETLENQCSGATDKLEEAINSFVECAKKIDDSLTVCTAIQTYTLNCTRPILKVIDDCLPEHVKGAPTLGVKGLLSVADYLCKQPAESIFELANPCLLEEWKKVEETGEIDPCKNKLRGFAEKHSEDIPSKTEICGFVTDLRSCIQTRTSAFCKNQKTKNVVLGVFDAFVVPCSHINKV